MSVGNRLLCCVAAILVAVPLFGAVPTASEREVLDVDMQLLDARVKGDVDALDKLLSPDLSYITSTARVEDKRSLLYAIRTIGGESA